MNISKNEEFMKIMKESKNYAQNHYLKMLMIKNAIMMMIMQEKMIEMILKKLKNY